MKTQLEQNLGILRADGVPEMQVKEDLISEVAGEFETDTAAELMVEWIVECIALVLSDEVHEDFNDFAKICTDEGPTN